MKPSRTQLDVVARLQAAGPGAALERWPGGFWTVTGTPVARMGQLDHGPAYAVPSWSTTVHTIRAMQGRGWLADDPADAAAPSWCRRRILTPEGAALAPPAPPAPMEPTP